MDMNCPTTLGKFIAMLPFWNQFWNFWYWNVLLSYRVRSSLWAHRSSKNIISHRFEFWDFQKALFWFLQFIKVCRYYVFIILKCASWFFLLPKVRKFDKLYIDIEGQMYMTPCQLEPLCMYKFPLPCSVFPSVFVNEEKVFWKIHELC